RLATVGQAALAIPPITLTSVEDAFAGLAVGVGVSELLRTVAATGTGAAATVRRVGGVVDLAAVLDVTVAVEMVCGTGLYLALAVAAPGGPVVDVAAAGFGVAVVAARNLTCAAVERVDCQLRFATLGVLR